MACVLLEEPDGSQRIARLVRPVTAIGSSEDNDIIVKSANLEATHARITKDPRGFVVSGMLRDMTVNGRRTRERRLENLDIVRFGNLKIIFYENDEEAPRPKPNTTPQPAGKPAGVTVEVVSAYKRVHEFSLKLLQGASTANLVETILDSLVELTGADKGFLVLIEEGRPVVRAARNLQQANVQTSLDQLSDSILRRVMESKNPLVVADALSDQEFNASESILNLKLLSVMCCPLLDRGELRGVLYVGNNRVANQFDETALDVMNVFAAQASSLLAQAQRIEELTRSQTELSEELEGMRFGRIVGACSSMKDVFKRVRKVATTDVSVLITGETGTGKELIAREIHRSSPRVKGPFVVINCGAIPENLLESELFGHVRGAFTGAVADKEGRFQSANGGTLFLDEIGEMPLPLQVKLLRALQEHVVTRVGGTKSEPVDIRVVAATNRILEAEIKGGTFREDLYYRLNVVNVALPPLRDRGEDLETLAKYFLAKANKEHGRRMRGFSKAGLVGLRKYRWPGNVRELENRVKKAVVLADGPLLTAADLDIQESDLEEVVPLAEAKERFQIRYINQVLDMNGGNRTKTAKDLGVDPRTIFRHLEKLQNQLPSEDGQAGLEVDGNELSEG